MQVYAPRQLAKTYSKWMEKTCNSPLNGHRKLGFVIWLILGIYKRTVNVVLGAAAQLMLINAINAAANVFRRKAGKSAGQVFYKRRSIPTRRGEHWPGARVRGRCSMAAVRREESQASQPQRVHRAVRASAALAADNAQRGMGIPAH